MVRAHRVKTETLEDETLKAWENMRLEILHELQDGGSAEIPDTLVDEIGNLVVELEFRKEKVKHPAQLPIGA